MGQLDEVLVESTTRYSSIWTRRGVHIPNTIMATGWLLLSVL